MPASRAAPDGTLCISGSGQRTRRGSVSDCPRVTRTLGTQFRNPARAVRESTGTAKEQEARRFLKAREGLVPMG